MTEQHSRDVAYHNNHIIPVRLYGYIMNIIIERFPERLRFLIERSCEHLTDENIFQPFILS